MGFLTRFIAKIALNSAALYLVQMYFPGFLLGNGSAGLLLAATLLAFLNLVIRPIITLIATPLIWITFGLFHLIINMIILWGADMLLAPLAISDLSTLFWASLLIALVNSII